jgi:hypothetical protein
MVQVIAWPTGSGLVAGLGVQLTTAPAGKPPGMQLALAAGLGPLLVQVRVPFTGTPTLAVAGKPASAACMSACGSTDTTWLETSLPGMGSVVLVPAVATTVSEPLSGAVKAMVQAKLWPTANGLGAGAGVQDTVAPAGKPVSTQVGATAGLGPLLLHVAKPVTAAPGAGLLGRPEIRACMSARGVTEAVAWSTLLSGNGSTVLALAVPTTVTAPALGAVNATLQVMALPTPSCKTGTVGAQPTVAPGGKPLGTQLAFWAMLGPLLVQVTTPFTVLPAGGVAGIPVTTACISARGEIAKILVSLLLGNTGSSVIEPAVVVMLSGPLCGAVKVLVHTISMPAPTFMGFGAGVHDWVAPAGKPLKAQLAPVAGLTPRLIQVPLTVTESPALTVAAGKVVVACISACGTTLVLACAALLVGSGSAVVEPATPVIVKPPLTGANMLTEQLMVPPTAKLVTGGVGVHTIVAPLGKLVVAHVAAAAALGPKLVHTTVPVTVLPAKAVAGMPVTTASISAWGTKVIGSVSTLLAGVGSVVLEPAVVVMLKVPLPGAVKLLVQLILAPTAKGLGTGEGKQLVVAPGGRPLITQVAAAAGLGPALVQLPVTVTGSPALTLAGTTLEARMSACETTLTTWLVTSLAGTGSAVAVPAVPTTVTLPLAGAVKLTEHTIAAVLASEPTGVAGTQLTTAPPGKPEGTQVALAALLGPLLVQVTVPFTVLPALAVAGKPATKDCISACGVIAKGLVSMLLAGVGSVVLEPAVVVMLSAPLAGAVKVLVHVIKALKAKGLGTGAGVQDCVAPTGKPLKAQLAAAALLGPKLVHTPLTVTLCPAKADAGTVVTARMSACGTTLKPTCWLLLSGNGSAVVEPAVPVMVALPVSGTG